MMQKRLKTSMKASAAVAAAAVTDLAVMRIFLNIAVERRCRFFKGQKDRKKPCRDEIRQGMEWMEQQKSEAVTIESFDGLKLRGHYVKAKEARRIMVMFHGWRGTWKRDFGACARELYEEGCSLLLPEQRAQGESEGTYMGFGILERHDCHAWLDWVEKNNRSHLPVYLYGVSMGASTVLMAAGGVLPACVKGIIADCGFSYPDDMVLNFGRKHFRLVGVRTVKRLTRWCRRKAGFGFDDYSVPEALKDCDIPVLFIHGRADTFVPCGMTIQNYEACRGRKRLLLVEGADHCGSHLKDREAYMEAVRWIWEQNDGNKAE